MGKITDIAEVLLEMGLESPSNLERSVVDSAIVKAEAAVKRYLNYDPLRALRTEYYPQMDQSNLPARGYWESNSSSAYLVRESSASADELQLQHLPIRSNVAMILSIDTNGKFDTVSGAFTTASVEGTDFWPRYDGLDDDGNKICRDGMILSSGRWPLAAGSVKIIYTAGYTLAELHGQKSLVDASQINDAIIGEATIKSKKALATKKHIVAGFVSGVITAERMGDYNYAVDPATAAKLFGSSLDITSASREKLENFVNCGWTITN